MYVHLCVFDKPILNIGCVDVRRILAAAAETAIDSSVPGSHCHNRIGTVDSLDRFNNNRSADGQTAGRLAANGA